MPKNGPIASTFFFAAEAIKHQKNKKKAKEQETPQDTTTQPTPSSGQSFQDESPDEEALQDIFWELDETAEQLHDQGAVGRAEIPKGIGKDPARISVLVEAFVSVHRPILRSSPADLPYAVILPQRRPESRSRGFVRAYATCLGPCGISEETFMQFHDFYNESLKFSNAVKVINVISGIVGMVPSPAIMVTTTIIGAAATAAGSLQSRQRSHDFLSRMNVEYFMPMGLICLVMKYSTPDKDKSGTDLNEALSKAIEQPLHHNFSASHGQMGQEEMPLAAPLVFPELNEAAKQGKMDRSKRYMLEYLDRRAHAQFAIENPDSQIAHSMEGHSKFENSWSDPRNNAGISSRGPVATLANLATGRAGQGSSRGGRPGRGRGGGSSKGPGSMLKSLRKKSNLYMMIVPLPTKQQIDAVQENPPAYLEGEEIYL